MHAPAGLPRATAPLGRLRQIGRVRRAHADREPVPGIDHRDRDRKIGQRLLVELAPDLLIDLVGGVGGRDIGQRFSPGQRRPLAVGVEGRLVPSVEQIQPRGCLAELAGLLRMHVQAVGAAIDLRYTDFDERHQLVIEAAALQIVLNRNQSSNSVGRSCERVQSLRHGLVSIVGCGADCNDKTERRGAL